MPPNLSAHGHYAVKLFAEDLKPEPIINPFLLRKPFWSEWFPASRTSFIVDGVPQGKYRLYVVGDGVAATDLAVDVASSEQEVTVLADQPTVSLQGRVLWADTGEPVPKALVSRSWYPWELEVSDISALLDRFKTTTDEQGNFAFSNLTQGRYLLYIDYAAAVVQTPSGTSRKTLNRQRVELPACGESYIFYLGRRDGIAFVNQTAPESNE